MTNNVDLCWPNQVADIDNQNTTQKLLNHPNLNRLYVLNPIVLHPKVRPVPIGQKWQYKSTRFFGESKTRTHQLLSSVATSGSLVKERLRSKLHLLGNISLWVRPASSRNRKQYNATNAALKLQRKHLCSVLRASAPNYVQCGGGLKNQSLTSSSTKMLSPREYFDMLQRHSFVASPAGHGLDSHATWEALMAGTIPIVPHSTLDPMFETLPVWLVDDWAKDVTPESIPRQVQHVLDNIDRYEWDKNFAKGWIEEMQQVAYAGD